MLMFASYRSFAYECILPMSGSLFIKLDNAFVFPDSKPPIINNLYGSSGIYGHIGLRFILFSFI